MLIELSDLPAREVLAVNPHLTSAQITQLLKLSGQLVKTKATEGQTTAVLLASRPDLTAEHITLLLKSKNSLLLLALLTPPQKSAVVFDYQMLQELVAHPRFNRWYATTLHGSNFIMGEKVKQQLYYYSYQSYRYNRSRTMSESFRSNKQRLAEIRYRASEHPRLTRDQNIQFSRDNDLKEYYEKLLDLPLPEVIVINSASALFAQVIQAEIGQADVNFYRLFYSLIGSWTSSVKELISTSYALTEK